MLLLINISVFVLLHPFLTVAVILIGLYFVIVGTIGELESESDEGGFNYHNIEAWKDKFPACGGTRQSPIDLNSRYFDMDLNKPSFKFTGYNNLPLKIKIKNTGHSLELRATWPSNETPYFEGGPFEKDVYVFQQLHFHWGATDNVGSEHTVNLQSFPLELHMVHYNKKYGSIRNATNYADGLSVIGVFFDIQLDASKGLQNILKEINGILKPKSVVAIKPFPLSDFEGVINAPKYVSYPGSLTTPPCYEIVTWVLPIIMLDVTKAQMETFRLMQLEHDDNHNNRPVQPINDRLISIYKHVN